MGRFARALIQAAAGSVPGLLIGVLHDARIGIAVGVLGAIIGLLLSIQGTSARRTLWHAFAIIVARHIPGAFEALSDVAEAEGDDNDRLRDPLLRWLLAPQLGRRRTWIVGIGLAVGAAVGGAFAHHEVRAVWRGEATYFLDRANSKDSLTFDATLLALSWAVWGAGLAAVAASSAWRRPVVLATAVGALFGGLIGFAAGKAPTSRGGPLQFALVFGSLGTAFALGMTALLALDLPRLRRQAAGGHPSGSPRHELQPPEHPRARRHLFAGLAAGCVIYVGLLVLGISSQRPSDEIETPTTGRFDAGELEERGERQLENADPELLRRLEAILSDTERMDDALGSTVESPGEQSGTAPER